MTQATDAAANVATRFTDRQVQANHGHKPAFVYGDKRYSYTDLAALANRAGNLLKSNGVTPGARVLVLIPGSPAWFACVIGAIKIGAVPVLIDRPGDAAAVKACADSCKPVLAAVHQNFIAAAGPALTALGAEKVLVVGQGPAGHPSFMDGMRVQPSSLQAEGVAPDAVALTLAGGGAGVSLTHRELGSLQDGQHDRGLGPIAATLRALAKAEEAPLP